MTHVNREKYVKTSGVRVRSLCFLHTEQRTVKTVHLLDYMSYVCSDVSEREHPKVTIQRNQHVYPIGSGPALGAAGLA
jgi:hypothetical protein